MAFGALCLVPPLVVIVLAILIRRAFEPLLKTFQQLLKPNGTILLTEPNREMFKPFISSLDTEGYAFKQTQRNINLKNHTFLVNIYEITRL